MTAADLCEEAGLNVIPLPDEIREELKKQGNAIWDWVTNPVDFSIALEDSASGPITKMMVENPNFDLSIIFIDSKTNRHLMTSDALLKRFPVDDLEAKPLFVALLDRGRNVTDTGEYNKLLIELTTKLVEKHIPIYPTVARAANAAGKMVNYYQKQRADLVSQ